MLSFWRCEAATAKISFMSTGSISWQSLIFKYCDIYDQGHIVTISVA